MSVTLQGRVALVTGGAQGQGRSHAIGLAEAGADVIVLDRCSQDSIASYPMGTRAGLEETVDRVRELGRRAVAVEADLRAGDALATAVDAAVADLGRLDIVVANAGICTCQAWSDVSDEIWNSTIETNLTGTWNTCRVTAPHLKNSGGGSIVMISSVSGVAGPPFQVPYVASKWGVVGLMRALAAELGADNIRVNTINPGGVDTAMGNGVHDQIVPLLEANANLASLYGTLLPSDYRMVPEDITPSVVYLASDAARFVTGVSLSVDQGSSAR